MARPGDRDGDGRADAGDTSRLAQNAENAIIALLRAGGSRAGRDDATLTQQEINAAVAMAKKNGVTLNLEGGVEARDVRQISALTARLNDQKDAAGALAGESYTGTRNNNNGVAEVGERGNRRAEQALAKKLGVRIDGDGIIDANEARAADRVAPGLASNGLTRAEVQGLEARPDAGGGWTKKPMDTPSNTGPRIPGDLIGR